ncbi:MAG: hypothetical protein MZV65_18330 [Chromatiales bacterium]|nr:hypothetical protein [Chromatiales bacterium]
MTETPPSAEQVLAVFDEAERAEHAARRDRGYKVRKEQETGKEALAVTLALWVPGGVKRAAERLRTISLPQARQDGDPQAPDHAARSTGDGSVGGVPRGALHRGRRDRGPARGHARRQVQPQHRGDRACSSWPPGLERSSRPAARADAVRRDLPAGPRRHAISPTPAVASPRSSRTRARRARRPRRVRSWPPPPSRWWC